MKINYCLPIIKTGQKEMMATINNNRTQYSNFELWMDYISDLDILFVQKIIKEYNSSVIINFRRQKLDTIHMSLKQRKEIIKLLNDTRTYLDLDVSTQQEELFFIKRQNLKVLLITSYHNYNQTPDDKTLWKIIKKMKNYNPHIYKIATYCQTPDDALRLLSILLQLKKQDVRCIMLGMGQHGEITRIFGTLWGNELIFAPVDKKDETAPNMFTKNQLETIFSKLEA